MFHLLVEIQNSVVCVLAERGLQLQELDHHLLKLVPDRLQRAFIPILGQNGKLGRFLSLNRRTLRLLPLKRILSKRVTDGQALYFLEKLALDILVFFPVHREIVIIQTFYRCERRHALRQSLDLFGRELDGRETRARAHSHDLLEHLLVLGLAVSFVQGLLSFEHDFLSL